MSPFTTSRNSGNPRNSDNPRTSRNNVERRTQRAYLREFVPAIAAYVVVLFAVVGLVDFERAGSWKYAVAILPVVPALFAVRAVARNVGRVDELQRLRMLEGMAVGFGVAMVVAITIGFLTMAGLDVNSGSPWIVYAAGMGAWAVHGSTLGKR